MTLKHWTSLALSGALMITLINIIGLFPESKAPLEKNPNIIQASLLNVLNQSPEETNKKETVLLLNLIEQVIDQDRDYNKAKQIIESNTSGEYDKMLQLYSAKISSRTLEFETAQRLLDALPIEKTGLLKAIVLIAKGDREQAESALHEVIAANIDAYSTSRALALLNIYHEFDRHKESDESFLWTLFAQKLGNLKEFEISLYLTEKALEKNPGYRDAWLIKGYNEYQLEQWTNAEHSLMSAYNVDPGNAQIQYLLGLVYHKLGELELSTQFLLYAQQNNSPYQGDILEKLGSNALSQGDYALAEHYFKDLLELVDNHQNALTQLVWLYAEPLQSLEKALEYAELLKEAYPNDPNSYQLLSWVYTKNGQLDEANRALNTAKSLE